MNWRRLQRDCSGLSTRVSLPFPSSHSNPPKKKLRGNSQSETQMCFGALAMASAQHKFILGLCLFSGIKPSFPIPPDPAPQAFWLSTLSEICACLETAVNSRGGGSHVPTPTPIPAPFSPQPTAPCSAL